MGSVRAFSSLLGVCGLALACSSGNEGPTLPYALTARPMLPFPTDELLHADASSPTGLRMTIGKSGTNLGDVDEALYLFGDDFAAAFAHSDGWSTLGPVFAQVGEPVDVSTLDEHLLLIDLSARAIVPTEKRAFGGMTSYGKKVEWVSARSPLPLAAMTRHAIVMTRGLRTAAGSAFARDPVFGAVFDGASPSSITGEPARVTSAIARMAGVREALAAAGVRAEDVLVADTFTTQSVREESDALLAAYRAAPAPVVDAFGPPSVFAHPADDPRWEGPADADNASIAAIVRAVVAVPNFREHITGRLVFEGMQAKLQGEEKVEALLSIPVGAGPFPMVVFQHGVGDRKEQMWRWAPELAKEGVGMIAFDAPLHGFRTDKPGSSATNFINIVDPSLVVDNFRQAECEHAYLVRVIDALAAADLLGDGSHPIDATKLFWLGHSLGSMIGSVVLGLEPRYQGGVLIVGGGTMLEFFDRVLGGFALHEFPAELFMTVAQTAMDKGDPTNYARLSADKQVMLFQAMEDETMPPKATESLGRAMGLPQIAPVFEAIDGVEMVNVPAERRGWAQYSPARHSLAYAPENAPDTYAAARARLFHFVSSWAKTGVAEIQ